MASQDLCTTAQVKAAVGIAGTDDDARIAALITAASEAIMQRYGREFAPQSTAVARTFAVRSRVVDFAPYDLRAATTVELHPEASSPTVLTANTGYTLMPLGGAVNTASFLSLRIADDIVVSSDFCRRFGYAQIRITGDWGVWTTASVSEDVNRAAVITVLAWLDRPASQVADVMEIGDVRSLQPAAPSSWAIPNAAHALLRPYTRPSYLGVF